MIKVSMYRKNNTERKLHFKFHILTNLARLIKEKKCIFVRPPED